MVRAVRRSVDRLDLIKSLGLIGALFSLATMAAGGWTVWTIYTRTWEEAFNRVSDLATLLAEQASHRIQVADILLRTVQARVRDNGVRTDQDLLTAFASPDGRQFVRMLAGTLPAADGVALFAADGSLVAKGRPGAGFSIADRDYFHWARDRRSQDVHVAGSWANRARGLDSFYVIRRIETAEGRFLGAAVVVVVTRQLGELYRSLARDRHVSISLRLADGTLLLRDPPASPSLSSPGLSSPGLSSCAQSVGGALSSPLRDTPAAVRPVPGYALAVDVAADVDAILATWWSRSIDPLLATAALSIALPLVLLGLGRQVRLRERYADAAGVTPDVPQTRTWERALTQSQKMEALGTLAGGVAHDFNNLLGVIIGNLDLLRTMLDNAGEAAELCDEALDGATRGADLVKRLLAFARRQPLQPQVVEVNPLVSDVVRLLRRAVGMGVVLRMDLGEEAGSVLVDPVQLQAALVNLGTNARDAMPNGGRVHISTHAVSISPADQDQHDGLAPGRYVVITVRDTGAGMAPDVMRRIFEPFYSTKGPERGTGLGLSMVLGFIEQSGGYLSLRSEPGVGSSFRLYLPRMQAGPADAAAPGRGTPAVHPCPSLARDQRVTGRLAGERAIRHETVLLVDPNPGVRRATVRQLAALGYRVREVGDAASALGLLERRDWFDILLTDLELNGVGDGLDLAEAARLLRPGLHVVIMSGWMGIRDAKARLGRWGQPLLGKPFFTDELAATLRGETPRQAVW